jgi:hypothetical protein
MATNTPVILTTCCNINTDVSIVLLVLTRSVEVISESCYPHSSINSCSGVAMPYSADRGNKYSRVRHTNKEGYLAAPHKAETLHYTNDKYGNATDSDDDNPSSTTVEHAIDMGAPWGIHPGLRQS